MFVPFLLEPVPSSGSPLTSAGVRVLPAPCSHQERGRGAEGVSLGVVVDSEKKKISTLPHQMPGAQAGQTDTKKILPFDP